jgi:hypothetical protein
MNGHGPTGGSVKKENKKLLVKKRELQAESEEDEVEEVATWKGVFLTTASPCLKFLSVFPVTYWGLYDAILLRLTP